MTRHFSLKDFCQPAATLDFWKSWFGIFVGCAILGAAFVYFINPYNIVPGGVYGASIVLHNIFPSIQVGTFGYMFDIPLLTISVIVLGGKLGSRTIGAALLTPLLMNVMSKLSYPTQAALEALDPAQLLGGCIDMSEHLMLTCIFGSVLIGVGCGLIVRHQATSGGTDIVAMILQKYAHIRFSTAIFLVDGMVVCFGLLVIGFGIGNADGGSEQASWLLSFYSLIAIFVSSRVIAYVINGAKDDKLLFIITERNFPELRDFILNGIERSATIIKSSGLYSRQDKDMLFLVVSHREVNAVKSKIKELDPRAFVVVTDAYDTFGEGWKQLPSKDDLTPE